MDYIDDFFRFNLHPNGKDGLKISEKNSSITILKSDKPIYCLVYVRSSTAKDITMFKSKTGNMLYLLYLDILP